MAASANSQQFAVLYVDDEEGSLKYFRMAYEKDFPVLIAKSAAEARDVLDRENPPVAVLICDQRMPGETGTDLLAEVRRTRPEIIRILTTAYSDLESAIEAVNAGEVYRYVVKPWDVRELRATLTRAMELFTIRHERDILLREKLSVLQQMMLNDRLRSFGAFAAALEPVLPGALAGFVAFQRLLPEGALAPQEVTPTIRNLAEMAEHTRLESVRSLRLIGQFSARVDWPSAGRIEQVAVGNLVAAAVRKAAARHEGDPSSIWVELPDGLPAIKACAHLCEEALSGLIAFALAAAKEPPCISASKADDAVSVHIRIAPDASANALSLRRAQAPVLELLFSSLLAHHLHGSIALDARTDAQWEVALTVPMDGSAAPAKTVDDNTLANALDPEGLTP